MRPELFMNQLLKSRFPLFKDEVSLRAAIESVCAEFGTVTHLRVLPARDKDGLRCACLMRLDCAAAEARLKAKLHVFDLGSEIAFFADVDDAWTGETV